LYLARTDFISYWKEPILRMSLESMPQKLQDINPEKDD
jgi:hypothetical protein